MYRWVDHTAEIELRVEAETEDGVFADSLVAIAELTAGELAGVAVRRELSLSAVDRATLLAEWLEELVYLSESEGFVAERLVSLELGERDLRATVEGRQGMPRYLVKAVTYHGLALERADGGWRARVVLDV